MHSSSTNPIVPTSPCSQLFSIFCPVSVCLGYAGCKISGARYYYCSLCIIHCMNRQLDTDVLLLQQCGTEVSLVWKMLLLLHIFTSSMHLSCKQKGQLLMQVRHFLRKTVGRMSTHHFVSDSSMKIVQRLCQVFSSSSYFKRCCKARGPWDPRAAR